MAITLACVVCALSLAHLLSQGMKYFLHHDTQFGLEPLFYLENEGNIPSWFSSSILLLSGILLGIIGQFRRTQEALHASHWLGLAGLFVLLSLDESVSFHEMTKTFFQPLHLTGFFRYSWVIFGMVFSGIVGVIYIPFLRQLQPEYRKMFLVAGSIYIAGAIGVEMFGGRWHSLYGKENMGYALHVWVEETLEMTGIVLFIYALSRYIEEHILNTAAPSSGLTTIPPDSPSSSPLKKLVS